MAFATGPGRDEQFCCEHSAATVGKLVSKCDENVRISYFNTLQVVYPSPKIIRPCWHLLAVQTICPPCQTAVKGISDVRKNII